MTSLAENQIQVKNLLPPHTRYRKGVKAPNDNMLKRGKQNAKLGDKVTVKMWKGMTMYSLTLEERATCPSECQQWDNCYGNNMPFGHRFDHTHPEFETKLNEHLSRLNTKHPDGFIVRLHVLGDFYSEGYVAQWNKYLLKFPALRVFGYTHHKLDSDIGEKVQNLNKMYTDRWRVRFSDEPKTNFNAVTTRTNTGVDGIMCPEQAGLTDSCATCGYCWSSDKAVIFIEH